MVRMMKLILVLLVVISSLIYIEYDDMSQLNKIINAPYDISVQANTPQELASLVGMVSSEAAEKVTQAPTEGVMMKKPGLKERITTPSAVSGLPEQAKREPKWKSGF